MDNFQFWLYVIVALIYVISRAMKKSNQQRREARKPTSQDMQETADTGRERPLTFEELLREITEGKKRVQQPAPKPQPKAPSRPAYVDYDDDLEDEEKSLEDVDYDFGKKESAFEVFEKARKDALRDDTTEESKPAGEDIKYGRFTEFRIGGKNTLLQEYVKELKKPSGFKRAIVLSEILNRKF